METEASFLLKLDLATDVDISAQREEAEPLQQQSELDTKAALFPKPDLATAVEVSAKRTAADSVQQQSELEMAAAPKPDLATGVEVSAKRAAAEPLQQQSDMDTAAALPSKPDLAAGVTVSAKRTASQAPPEQEEALHKEEDMLLPKPDLITGQEVSAARPESQPTQQQATQEAGESPLELLESSKAALQAAAEPQDTLPEAALPPKPDLATGKEVSAKRKGRKPKPPAGGYCDGTKQRFACLCKHQLHLL